MSHIISLPLTDGSRPRPTVVCKGCTGGCTHFADSFLMSQAQHDYLQGNYPVVREDAAQMCALQMQAEAGPTLLDQSDGVEPYLEKFIVRQVSCGKSGDRLTACLPSKHVHCMLKLVHLPKLLAASRPVASNLVLLFFRIYSQKLKTCVQDYILWC